MYTTTLQNIFRPAIKIRWFLLWLQWKLFELFIWHYRIGTVISAIALLGCPNTSLSLNVDSLKGRYSFQWTMFHLPRYRNCDNPQFALHAPQVFDPSRRYQCITSDMHSDRLHLAIACAMPRQNVSVARQTAFMRHEQGSGANERWNLWRGHFFFDLLRVFRCLISARNGSLPFREK